jgi:hypothetical protein
VRTHRYTVNKQSRNEWEAGNRGGGCDECVRVHRNTMGGLTFLEWPATEEATTRRVRMRRVRAGASVHHEQTMRERVGRPWVQAVQRAGFSGGKRKGAAEGARQAGAYTRPLFSST